MGRQHNGMGKFEVGFEMFEMSCISPSAEISQVHSDHVIDSVFIYFVHHAALSSSSSSF